MTLAQQLADIVGQQHLLLADRADHRLLRQPYLQESRGRKTGQAQVIVFPADTQSVAEVVAVCRRHQVPMVPQGGNTGRCLGAQSDDKAAVIINLKRLNKIRAFDENNQTITVEAGCLLQTIQDTVAAQGYYFPLLLGSQGSCQIGGNLATNAGGLNVLRYGNARELTLGIEAVTADGKILNALDGLRKNNTGYDLKQLFIGSEGTLGLITAATLKVFPKEAVDEQAFLAVTSLEDALVCLNRLQTQFSGKVSTFEVMPNLAMQLLEKHSDLRCPIGLEYPWYVWAKIADNHEGARLFDDYLQCLSALMTQGKIVDATISQNEDMKKTFARIRERIVDVQKQHGYSIKFDVAVPVSAVPKLIEKGNRMIKSICAEAQPYPFGHLGDGNIHYNIFIPFNQCDKTRLDELTRTIGIALYDLVEVLSGTFSAEHGIGSLKLKEMQRYKDPVALGIMRQIKQALDPQNLMNPGKVVPD